MSEINEARLTTITLNLIIKVNIRILLIIHLQNLIHVIVIIITITTTITTTRSMQMLMNGINLIRNIKITTAIIIIGKASINQCTTIFMMIEIPVSKIIIIIKRAMHF